MKMNSIILIIFILLAVMACLDQNPNNSNPDPDPIKIKDERLYGNWLEDEDITYYTREVTFSSNIWHQEKFLNYYTDTPYVHWMIQEGSWYTYEDSNKIYVEAGGNYTYYDYALNIDGSWGDLLRTDTRTVSNDFSFEYMVINSDRWAQYDILSNEWDYFDRE